ncbi:MAG: DNA replication and repair protein RecF [Deltaproteobacteria bacterium]|nr:DNA replication and repair protein RecF [Deltaproteobacteria bacterium]
MGAAVRIQEFTAQGFRNLAGVRLWPDPGANVLLGSNGQGKTSALEAVDYVASLRSFRGATRAQLLGHESPMATLGLRVDAPTGAREYRVRLTRTAREVLLDGKRPERAVDYFGSAACVAFQPGDLDLVRGSPELRRRLLDRVLLRALDGYGEALKSYTRALKARNALLRERTPEARAVQSYDYPLARYGSALTRARGSLAAELREAVARALGALDLTGAPVELAYRPRGAPDAEAFTRMLAEALPQDLARRTSTVGPHADDLALAWGGKPARVVASQGQTRALALALRLAELHAVAARNQCLPVLLLDDVSSELDRPRTERLFAYVAALGAQLWVTTTDPSIAALVPRARLFQVRDGRVSPEHV